VANRFRQALRLAGGYWPSQQVVGDSNDTVIAGRNVVFRGTPGQIYGETWKGISYDISSGGGTFSPVNPLINAVCATGQDSISSTGGTIGTKLKAGMLVLLDRKLYLITSMPSSNTATISPSFEGTGGTYPLTLPYTISPINGGVAYLPGGGNAVSLPRGHVLTTGSSTPIKFRWNMGADGAGGRFSSWLTVTGLPTLVPYTSDFTTPVTLGLTTPPLIDTGRVAALPGGIKQMPAGLYSLRIARGRSETIGYGNPSEASEVQVPAGYKMRIIFPPTEAGQTTWHIFGSLYSVAEGKTGPWYEIVIKTKEDVQAGAPPENLTGTWDFEYRDFEIANAQLATFDNNAPTGANLIAYFGGTVVLLSCLGGALSDVPGTRPPGPSLSPSKAYNIEGYPALAQLATGPVQDIIGYIEAEGRLYAYTRDYIHIVTLTGNADQPLTIRPLAQSSLIRSGAIVYVQGVLYGYGRKGPFRIMVGEGLQQEERAFASAVRKLTQTWAAARVCVAYDPYTSSVIFMHANDHMEPSAGGPKWVTVALAYHLNLDRWSVPCVCTHAMGSLNDYVVTSGCTVNGRALFFADQGISVWEKGQDVAGEPGQQLDWFLSTVFLDQGGEGLQKNIRRVSLTYDANLGYFGIYGGTSTEEIPLAELEVVGAVNAETSQITLPNTDHKLTSSKVFKPNCKNMRLYAVKVGAHYDGSGAPHRIDEIVVEGTIHGPQR